MSTTRSLRDRIQYERDFILEYQRASMNQINKIECPGCSSEFNRVHRIEKHVIDKHCKFCGEEESAMDGSLSEVSIMEELDYDNIIDKIRSELGGSEFSVELERYKGGFVPVIISELLDNSDRYVDSDGRLTNLELLEYHEIHEPRSRGMACDSCCQKYENVVQHQ